MGVIFTESLIHWTWFKTEVYESNKTHMIMNNFKTQICNLSWNFGNKLFFFNLSHLLIHALKKMLLGSLNIPLKQFMKENWSSAHFCRIAPKEKGSSLQLIYNAHTMFFTFQGSFGHVEAECHFLNIFMCKMIWRGISYYLEWGPKVT